MDGQTKHLYPFRSRPPNCSHASYPPTYVMCKNNIIADLIRVLSDKLMLQLRIHIMACALLQQPKSYNELMCILLTRRMHHSQQCVMSCSWGQGSCLADLSSGDVIKDAYNIVWEQACNVTIDYMYNHGKIYIHACIQLIHS